MTLHTDDNVLSSPLKDGNKRGGIIRIFPRVGFSISGCPVTKVYSFSYSLCLSTKYLGRPLSLNLTNLTILLRRIDNGDTFSAPLRQGITSKKNNEIAIGHIVYMGASI